MAAFHFLVPSALALLGCGRVGFDATAADAGPLGPLCDRVAGAVYCSDFEGGDLAGADNATLFAAPGAGWLGSDGYRATAPRGMAAKLGTNLPAVVTTGELHIGGRMLLAAGPVTPDYVVIAQAVTMTNNKISFDLATQDRIQLVNTVNGAGGRSTVDGQFPRDRWFCFELAIYLAPIGGGGRVDVLVDNAVAFSAFEDLATTPPNGFYRVEIGLFASPANTNAETAVFDNWIVASQAIGCP